MADVVQINIKYLYGAPEIKQVDGSDWIDLYTYEDVSLAAGCFTMVSESQWKFQRDMKQL